MPENKNKEQMIDLPSDGPDTEVILPEETVNLNSLIVIVKKLLLTTERFARAAIIADRHARMLILQ